MMFKTRVAAALALSEIASAANMNVSPKYYLTKTLIIHVNIAAISNYGSNRGSAD